MCDYKNGGEIELLKTILKRVLQCIPTLFIVVTFTFVLTRMIPGNPAATILGPQASAADIQAMEIKLGLDQPKLTQFIDYIGNVLHGDFGTSYMYNQPVLDLIAERIPSTLQITVTALVIALILGVAIGMFSALHQYSVMDYVFMVLALVGGSTDSAPAWQALGLLLASILGRAVLNRFSQLQQTHAGYFMAANKRVAIGQRMKSVPMGYFNDRSLGNLTASSPGSAPLYWTMWRLWPPWCW